MTRKRRPPREIPPHYATGAAKLTATAADRYVTDIDGERDKDGWITMATAHWVIRDRQAGTIEHCYNVTRSEVEDRVAVLNRKAASRADNIAWGKLKKSGPRDRHANRKSPTLHPADLSTTEWVERLVSNPATANYLRECAAQARPLPLEQLERLLDQLAESDRPRPTPDDLEAISQQLFRKFGIPRADERR